MANEITTTLALSIGNHELTNLLVQSEVLKVEVEINRIQQEIDQNREKSQALRESCSKDIVDLAQGKLSKNIWALANLHQKLAGRRPLNKNTWSLRFEFPAEYEKIVQRPGSSNIELYFNIYRDYGDDSEETFEIGVEKAKLSLTKKIMEDAVKVDTLYNELSDLCRQWNKLKEFIKDTSQLEKRVLASLTKASADSNPEILKHLNSVVNILNVGNKLMIESD